MIWTMVKKELLSNLLTLRLSVALLFTVVLSVLSTLIGSMDFSERMQIYRGGVKEARAELAEATVYSEVEPSAIAPPEPLSVLCRGIDGRAGSTIGISTGYIPTSGSGGHVTVNSLFRVLLQIDFVTVVALLLSFLAVLLGFDGICGEQERGTLRLLLTHPVPRGHIVVAKVIGGMISLWIPLAVAFLLSLIVMGMNSDLHMSGEEWIRVLLFFLLSCVFLAQVFTLSLMVSTLVKRSATSLIICLFGWLLGAVAYPNLLPFAVRYGMNEPPFEEYVARRNELWEQVWEEVQEWIEQHPGPGEVYVRGVGNGGSPRPWGQPKLRYAHPKGYEWLQQAYALVTNKRLEHAGREYQAHWENQKPLGEEALLTDRLSAISPCTNYQVLSYILCWTTYADYRRFMDAGHRYRDTFIQYLRGKRAFSSRRWFTDDPPDQEPMFPHPEEIAPERLSPDWPFMKEMSEWTAQQEKRAKSDPRRKLDLTDLPKFGEDWHRSLSQSLSAMGVGLGVLVVLFGLSLTVATMAFLRYEPRE